jgi:hypothetical protein
MKGTLIKTPQGWVVEYLVDEKTPVGHKFWRETLSLHPDFIEMMDTCFTSKFSQEVEFEIVTEWENGEVGVNGLTYAKLIHHPVDTNEMIDHIGEVNEMIDHVPDVGKMVEDGAAPIDWLINQLENHIVLSAHGKLGTNRTGDYRIGLRKAIDFCHQAKEMEAKETLYTEEQVRDAIDMARKDNSPLFVWDFTIDEIIQSLKTDKL